MSSNISDVSKGSSPTLPTLPSVVLMAAAGSASNTDNIVSANYTKLSESLRRLTPQRIQCSVFCGGAHCKYETPDNWTKDSLAIQGIYSNWITDNILAMARPSTYVIIQKNVIQQFQSLDIKSIINLQTPREHASCGYPLESSGFTYDPNIFMENNIYYYNFSWKDYGEATMSGLLNMVKVVAFAAGEGRIAIHCHAGLGRTGVLIACYLVYSLRVNASAAIRYVRMKRPGSVQTRGQILCIRHFTHFISPQTITYHLKDHTDNDKYMVPFTLSRFLRKQKIALHGYEDRMYKFLPKIVHKICQRILQLCGCFYDDFPASNVPLTSEFICSKLTPSVKRHESIYSLTSTCSDSLLSPDTALSPSGSNLDLSSVASSPSSPNPSESSFDLLDGDSVDYTEEDIFENRCFQELEQHKHFAEKGSVEEQLQIHDVQDVADILITTDVNALKPEMRKRLHASIREINTSQIGWLKLDRETDLHLLVALLYEWLEKLKQPILDRDCLETIVIFQNQTEVCFSKFNSDSAVLVEYLIRFLTKLQPVCRQLQEDLLLRMAASLAQQTVVLRDVVLPNGPRLICPDLLQMFHVTAAFLGKDFKKLRDGTKECILNFLTNLYSMVDMTWRKKKSASTYALDNSEDELDNVESGYCGETC